MSLIWLIYYPDLPCYKRIAFIDLQSMTMLVGSVRKPNLEFPASHAHKLKDGESL